MAQAPIREYDAKKMFADYTRTTYSGILVQNKEDFKNLDQTLSNFVIKPDQLFGKRGKYGLIGVNLDIDGVNKWWAEHDQKVVTLGKQSGKLDTFLVEPFIDHTEEYYIAIRTERTYDEIFFSTKGGIDVEENWESVESIQVFLSEGRIQRVRRSGVKIGEEQLKEEKPRTLTPVFGHESRVKLFHIEDPQMEEFILTLYSFFVEYGFTYLEVNPFTKDTDGNIVCLDMVARVDTCEAYKQKEHWKHLEFVNPFGVEKSFAEKYIEELDASTGVSLKFRILNPDGRIWLLTSGGGASVILADTIGDMGLAGEVGNYGECSGNPDRENTRAYTSTLLEVMLANRKKGKYLIIAGAIANFTHIDKTFSGIIDAFREHIDEMRKQEIKILARRGGINDTIGLELMKEACKELGLECEIADGNVYMTDILKHIQIEKKV